MFAIDLGGYGECLKNIKINNNVCIGANAYEEVNEDGSYKYLIDLDKKEFLKMNPRYNEAGLDRALDNWRLRGLGFIDFEAKKCFENVELIGNTIIGSGGWAINGASRITQNVIIKDNYWYHCGGGYPYLFSLYSGICKNLVVENNEFPGRCDFRCGYFTDGITFRNNKNLKQIRTFGLCGNITIENNRSDSPLTLLWSHESNNYEASSDYTLDKVKEIGVNISYKNNEGTLSALFSDPNNIEKTSFFNIDIEYDSPINRADITDLNNISIIDPTNFVDKDQGSCFRGVRFSKPFKAFFLTYSSPYFEKGDIIAEDCQKWPVVKGDFYKNKLIENFSDYNYSWSNYANRNNINKISIVCEESGYLPGNSEYGFRGQCTHVSYIINGGLNIQNNAYINTDDNIYWSQNGGKLTQIPTHTQGVQTYTDEEGNSVDLYYIGKVLKAKIVCE